MRTPLRRTRPTSSTRATAPKGGPAIDTTAPRKHRTERIQARVTDEAKTLLETAAAMQGVSLSEFVLSSALQKAFETVQAQTNARLSVRDSAAFAEALVRPPEPNEALRTARARHRTDVGR